MWTQHVLKFSPELNKQNSEPGLTKSGGLIPLPEWTRRKFEGNKNQKLQALSASQERRRKEEFVRTNKQLKFPIRTS